MAKKDKTWQAPLFTETPQKRMGWVEEACIQEGESWLKGQTAYSDIPKALDIISGKIGSDANQKRSDLNVNHAKYDIRKIIETLADVRIGGQYTSDSPAYKQQAHMFNDVTRAVALEGQFPRKLRMALQYMGITGKGYIWPRYTRMNGEEGGIEFEPLGLLDVLPVQLPADNDLQKAYAVTIIVMMPVYMAHGKFPAFQASLLPIARRRYTSTVAARRLDLAERFKYGESDGGNWDNLYCEIRYTFIRDLSINESKDTVLPMGEENTSWFYEVPFLGKDIPAGVGSDGKQTTRKADLEDCMIYPYRRLMITSRGMNQPMYDGPAKDWSGMLPLAEYIADDWPWEPCGFSLTHDIHSIERARQRIERGVDQVLKARLDPAMAYDRTAGLNDGTAQTIDPFQERGRVGSDGPPDKLFATLLPQHLLEVPASAEAFLKYLAAAEDNQLGLNEINNLAEFKANINNEGLDKALSLVGPIVKGISGGIEASTVTVWQLMKFMVPQYYTTKRVMQYVGPDGVTPETFDYDPGKLIPSHGPDEFHNLPSDVVIANGSIYSLAERARMYAKNLRLIVVPHTMHEITQTQEQLKWLQLYRGGFPMAPHDVAQKLNIENYGEIEGDTIWDRYVNYKKLEIEMAAKLQQLMASLAPEVQSAAGMGGGAPGTGPHGGQKGTGGRAPSGQHSPKIKQKTGGPLGPRTVVSESG